MNFIAALVPAAAVSTVAYQLRALTAAGACAAAFVGAVVLGAGVSWAVVLLAFFLPATGLSRLPERHADHLTEKRGPRDAYQVLANGGVAAACALLNLTGEHSVWSLPFAASLAAAASDTWATEIGKRSSRLPRNLMTMSAVPAGTSGGVTPLGIAGGVAGAGVIAGMATLVGVTALRDMATVFTLGCAACLFDSLLGATIQERRFCDSCQLMTEQPVHRICGRRTRVAGGIPLIDNDTVNLLACIFAAVLALLTRFC